MDGTVVRHVNPRLLGVLEFLDDLSFKIGNTFRKKGPPPLLPDGQEKKPRLLVHRALHKIRRKPVEQIVQPCPGIYTVLNILKHHGIPMGIVSNGLGKGYGHDILEKFRLTPFFESQTFREDIARSKPHPDPLLKALQKIRDPLGAHETVWYIGERHKDVIAALAASDILPASVLPFSYGLNAAVAILEKGLGPDRIIVNYYDFAARLKDILRSA